MTSLYSRLLPALVSLWCLFYVTQAPLQAEPARDDTVTLHIISTSDIHANLSNFPALFTLVKEKRAHGGHVLLFDSGDCFSGNPYVDDAPKQGEPINQLMDKVGYNAVTFGNHELDYGIEPLKDRLKTMPKTAFLASNTTFTAASGMPECPKSCTISVTDTINVKVIGLCNFTGTNRHYLHGNLTWVKPAKDNIRSYLDLFKTNKATMNIVLSHLGVDRDRALFADAPGIDLILGGHSHIKLPNGEKLKCGALLGHAGAYLDNVGLTTVVFRLRPTPSIKSIRYECLSLSGIQKDQNVLTAIEQYLQKTDKRLQENICRLEEELSRDTMSCIFSEAIRQAVGADIGLYNLGGVRMPSVFPAGKELRVLDLYSMEPFRDYIALIEMTTEQIHAFILGRYKDTSGNGWEKDPLVGAGFSCSIKNGLVISTLEAGKSYKVAMNDYLIYNYPLPAGVDSDPSHITKHLVRDAVRHYLLKHTSALSTPPAHTSKISPAKP